MTTTEGLSHLFTRLETEGANLDHLRAVMDWMTEQGNARTARLARLYFGNEEGEHISMSDFATRFEDMTSRIWGLKALLHGFDDDLSGNKCWNGAHQLATDVASDMERLHEAFAAEVAASRPKLVNGTSALTLAFVQSTATRQAVERAGGRAKAPQDVVDAAEAAQMALASTPCDVAEVPSKLRELLLAHKRDHGDAWQEAPAPAFLAAVDKHFGAGFDERQAAEAAKTWPAYVGSDPAADGELSDLIAAHRAAMQAFHVEIDASAEDNSPFGLANAHYDAAREAEEAAAVALCAYQPKTLAGARDRAAYVISGSSAIAAEFSGNAMALLRSFLPGPEANA
jgi:hypothetical protein